MGLQTTYKGFTVYAEENPDRHRGGVAWSVCLHDEELDNGLCADWGQVLPDAAKSIDKLLEGKEEMNTPAQSVLTKSQTRTFERHDVTISGQKYRKIKAVVRFDDQCGNGHNTFSITGSAWEPRNFKENDPDTGGCIHELIAEAFPELAPLIKWHLVSTDGPMHYLANTTYLASDRDYNGLRAGETRQICNGRTGLLCWELAAIVDGEPRKARIDGVPNTIDAAEKPADPAAGLTYMPWCRTGEGKTPNIDGARRCAVWPDATPEQLQDKDALLARLPALMSEFRDAVLSLGFTY